MRVNSNKRLLSVAVLAAATALPITPVFAQSGVLEEVVVTCGNERKTCRTSVLP